MEDRRPHYLYRITCLKNDKEYVGYSHDPAFRFRVHKSNARRGMRRHLYSAMRRHGAKSFEMRVLCVGSKEYVRQLEVDYISHRDLQRLGYNSTEGGDGVSGEGLRRAVETNRKNGWAALSKGRHTMRKGGWKHLDAVRIARPCIAAGERYPSLIAAARALGKSKAWVWWHLKHGTEGFSYLAVRFTFASSIA